MDRASAFCSLRGGGERKTASPRSILIGLVGDVRPGDVARWNRALQTVIAVLPSNIYIGNSSHPYNLNAGRVSQEVRLQFGGRAGSPASLVRRGGTESHHRLAPSEERGGVAGRPVHSRIPAA